MNIPIYRAKKIDSDEYVEGYYYPQKDWETKCLKCGSLNTESTSCIIAGENAKCLDCGEHSYFHDDNWHHAYQGKLRHFITDNENNKTEIDSITLAIHFPDMLDSEGNKIFASLSEDGKGGDLVESGSNTAKLIAVYRYGQFHFISDDADSYGNRTHAEKYDEYIEYTRFDNHRRQYCSYRTPKVIGIQE